MLYIIGIAITFLLSFILLTKRRKSIADKILFGWLCMILIHLVLFSIIAAEDFASFPYLLGLEIPIPLLHGPLLFLYTTALTNEKSISRVTLFHFIPYVLALLSISHFMMLSPEGKIAVYQHEGREYSTLSAVIFIGILISGITYSIASLRLLMKYKRMIQYNYSYTEKINLQWLYRLILGLSGIWLVALVADDQYIFSCVVLFVIYIGYYGVKQVGIFANEPPAIDLPAMDSLTLADTTATRAENSKYQHSALESDQLEIIHKKLTWLMHEKQLFLTPELTLNTLAQKLDIHPNTLSQVINRSEQKNFFEYINTLRVMEFRKRVVVPENQKFTLLALAYDCGFNSKTSFNRNFKAITGQSPSAYLKELHIELK